MKKRYRLKKCWKITFSLIFVFILLSSSIKLTYSRYKSDININIVSDAGGIICTANRVGSGISTDGYAYFDIEIKNYNSSNKISDTYIIYNLKVSDDETDDINSSYRWTDENGYSNVIFENIAITRNYNFGISKKESQTIRIEVKTDSIDSENVAYNVEVSCYQSANFEEGGNAA